MGIIKEILEKFSKHKRHPNEELQNSGIHFDTDINLENVELVTATKNGFHRIKSGETLALVNQINNSNAEVKLKGTGYRVSLPLIFAPYYIDISKYTVSVKDTDYSDGRYRQPFYGDDIIIKLKITFEVVNEKESIGQLIKNSSGNLSAIRSAAENLMRCLIEEYYQKDQNKEEFDLKAYEKIPKSKSFNLEEIVKKDEDKLNQHEKEIVSIVKKLKKDNGISITDIHFADVDKPERLKKIVTDAIEERKKLEIKREQADAQLYIAEQSARAEQVKRQALIDYYQSLKSTLQLDDAQLCDIIKTNLVAKNGKLINIIGANENSNTTSRIVANETRDDCITREENNAKTSKR